jgi:hypothetical protein
VLEEHIQKPKPGVESEAWADERRSTDSTLTVLVIETLIFIMVFSLIMTMSYAFHFPYVAKILLILAGPSALGLFYGYVWGNRNLISLGLSVLLFTALFAGIYQVSDQPGVLLPKVHYEFSLAYLWTEPIVYLYIVGITMLLCGFTSVGNWIFHRTHPNLKRAGLSGIIARSLTSQSAGSPKDRMEQIERIRVTLTAVAPVLTLLGTVIGAVLTFLGIIYKPK